MPLLRTRTVPGRSIETSVNRTKMLFERESDASLRNLPKDFGFIIASTDSRTPGLVNVTDPIEGFPAIVSEERNLDADNEFNPCDPEEECVLVENPPFKERGAQTVIREIFVRFVNVETAVPIELDFDQIVGTWDLDVEHFDNGLDIFGREFECEDGVGSGIRSCEPQPPVLMDVRGTLTLMDKDFDPNFITFNDKPELSGHNFDVRLSANLANGATMSSRSEFMFELVRERLFGFAGKCEFLSFPDAPKVSNFRVEIISMVSTQAKF